MGGNKIWELMEEKRICPGRTWQSMKQRWDKFISKSLDKFGVTVDELEQRDDKDKSESEDDAEVSQRGFRVNANYYTNIEDLKIIEYMETRGVLTGRSWHSMKERFRKVIMKKIRSYGL